MRAGKRQFAPFTEVGRPDTILSGPSGGGDETARLHFSSCQCGSLAAFWPCPTSGSHTADRSAYAVLRGRRRRKTRIGGVCSSAPRLGMDGRPQPTDRLPLGGRKFGANADIGKGADCSATRRAFLQEYARDGGAHETNSCDSDCVRG